MLLAQDLVGLSDLIINRGSGASAVIQIIFHTFLPLATLTLPFAFLIGTLLGLGRLKADCEVLVIEAMGISGRTLLWPVSLIAIVMTIFAFLLTLEIAPYAARSRSQLFQQLVQDNPGVILRPGIVHEFGGSKIVVREISARGDQLRGVLLWMEEDGQTNLIGNTIFAEQATLTPQHNASATLTLLDGVALIPPQQGGGETRFNRFSTTLEGYAIAKDDSEDRLARASLASLARLAADPGPSPRLALQAHTEFHRRFASPAACLVFGLLAVALVLQSRQLSRATSGIAGLFVTIAYYGLVQLGEGLAQAQILGVGVSAWLPNITIGSFALLLLYQGELKAKTAWSIGRLTRPAFRPVQRIRFQRALLRARGVVAHYFFEPVRKLCARRYLLSRYIVRQYLQRIRFQRALLRARGVVAGAMPGAICYPAILCGSISRGYVFSALCYGRAAWLRIISLSQSRGYVPGAICYPAILRGSISRCWGSHLVCYSWAISWWIFFVASSNWPAIRPRAWRLFGFMRPGFPSWLPASFRWPSSWPQR